MKEMRVVTQFKSLLRFSGVFNITVASMFIFPKLYEYYLLLFNWVNCIIGLGGKDLSIPNDPFHALFINTAGIDLVLIGCIILITSANPLHVISRRIILANGIGRFLFTLFVCYYAIANGLMGIFVVFGIIDFIITSGFIYFLMKTKNISPPIIQYTSI